MLETLLKKYQQWGSISLCSRGGSLVDRQLPTPIPKEIPKIVSVCVAKDQTQGFTHSRQASTTEQHP
jgi:hypothetical protein